MTMEVFVNVSYCILTKKLICVLVKGIAIRLLYHSWNCVE